MKMADMTEKQLIDYLNQQGFYLYREYWMFGRMLSFQDRESGVKKYYLNGRLVDWPEVVADLRENWRPAAQEERDWFCANLGESTSNA